MGGKRARRSATGPDANLAALALRALAEDRANEDRTSLALLPGPTHVRAVILAEGRGVLSGVRPALAAARAMGVRARPLLRDGARVRAGSRVLRLSGDARRILAVERTILNLLMHLSGVASATDRAVRASAGALRVLGTRKTLPGLRALEKEAIVHGGGSPHRADLSEGVLVKSPHLELVPLPEALARLRKAYGPAERIEVEVRSVAEAVAAVRAGVRALLIDNAAPAAARRIVRSARAAARGARLEIELSGGITERTIGRFRSVGADAASLGGITHSAPALPFHLRLERGPPARRPSGRGRRR